MKVEASCFFKREFHTTVVVSLRALAFTRQCDLLKVDAILPFFMEFDTIGDFKDEVCTALEESTMAIEDLKMDMDEATKSAEHIRGDIKNLRSR
jgi:hypothetical protein